MLSQPPHILLVSSNWLVVPAVVYNVVYIEIAPPQLVVYEAEVVTRSITIT